MSRSLRRYCCGLLLVALVAVVVSAAPPGEPSPAKADVATYTFDPKAPTLLLQKQDKGWKRLPLEAKVASAAALVALPGSACAVTTDKGVKLLLRGFLPQFMPADPKEAASAVTSRLLESVVTLHQNDKVAADLTLHRGRLYIASGAMPATVIVRFGKEAWVVELTEANSEVGLDLVTGYPPQSNPLEGGEPKTEVFFVLLRGKAHLSVDTFEFRDLSAPPGVSFYAWSNQGARMPGPLAMSMVPAAWSKDVPATKGAREMVEAQTTLAGALRNQAPEAVLKEALASDSGPVRELALYSLAGLDAVGPVLDVLGDARPGRVEDRDEAAFALRRWISRDAGHNAALFNEKAGTGLLLDKGYSRVEAAQLLEMLHALPRTPELKARLVELLAVMKGSRQVALRHVAHFLFDRLTNTVKDKPAYNAADAEAARTAAVRKLTEMLDRGELTPN